MRKVNSQADVMTDWEALLDAVQKNPDLQPSVETERQSLAQSLVDVQGLKGRQNELRGLRQEITQQLAAAIQKGKDLAITVRSVVRGKVGPRNERLVHFDIAPIRSPRRKKKEKDPAGEASGESPSTAPSGQAPSSH
jgi:hypothetical protein